MNMDVVGEYASIKFTNEKGEPSLKFGEFRLDRDSDTIFVGANGFPIEEDGGEQNSGTDGN